MGQLFKTSNGVAKFMGARAKNIAVAAISVAALFGISTVSVLIFNPQAAIQITENLAEKMTAQASSPGNYSLPTSTLAPLPNSPDTAFLKAFSKVFSNIAKATRPSLVLIVAEKKVAAPKSPFPDDFFFPFLPPQFGGPGGPNGQQGGPQGPGPRGKRGLTGPQGNVETDAGSGFIVDLKNGYVITNNHVIDGADKITVTAYDNRKYKAKLMGTAKNVDIAVLKLLNFKPSSEMKQVSLADSAKVEVGDWVVALGAPFELPQTLTMGVVSALQRTSDTLGISSANSFIQTDAAINPGNSGGPLVNIDGQVIGMNTAIYSQNGTSIGIGFAIPSTTVRLAAESIINHGKLLQAYLGVEMLPLDKFGADALKQMNVDPNTEGGLVMKVLPSSPAAKAGLSPYDIIQGVNGVTTSSPSDIQRQIMFLKPNTQIKLNVLRGGKHLILTPTVVELTNQTGPASDDSNDDNSDGTQPKSALAAQYGLALSNTRTDTGGVAISSVQQGSVAAMAGLQQGDVILEANQQKISSAAKFEKILKDAQKSNSSVLFLLISRDNVQSAVILQLG